ncbi:hypothetical protein BDV59DRAFT_176391 [Aspergillus ambiguus]|uniref:uncharacterized protein n=1 Tax=Aspergillus ambiguus TaxID=176160 RepID=UPI003CCE2420
MFLFVCCLHLIQISYLGQRHSYTMFTWSRRTSHASCYIVMARSDTRSPHGSNNRHDDLPRWRSRAAGRLNCTP